jgi:uncharacterized membrane protein
VSPAVVSVVGIVIVAVGVAIRFAPLVEPPARLRFPLIMMVIPFAHAPRSWIPWGLAIALAGVPISAQGAIGVIAAGLVVILTFLGALLLAWSPKWMQPRSLRK